MWNQYIIITSNIYTLKYFQNRSTYQDIQNHSPVKNVITTTNDDTVQDGDLFIESSINETSQNDAMAHDNTAHTDEAFYGFETFDVRIFLILYITLDFRII